MIDIIGNIVISSPIREKFYFASRNSLLSRLQANNLIGQYNVITNQPEKAHGQAMLKLIDTCQNDYYLNFEEDHVCVLNDMAKFKKMLKLAKQYDVDVIRISFYKIEHDCASFVTEPIYEDNDVKIIRMTERAFQQFKTKLDRYYLGTNGIFKKSFGEKMFKRNPSGTKPHNFEVRNYEKAMEYTCLIPKFEILRAIDDDHDAANSCMLRNPTHEFIQLSSLTPDEIKHELENNPKLNPNAPYFQQQAEINIQPTQINQPIKPPLGVRGNNTRNMDINTIDDQNYGMETNTKAEADYFFEHLKPEHTVLEWGAGASSISIAKRVKQVFSIEHNGPFCEKIKPLLPSNVNLSFVPYNQEEGPGEDGNYEQYKDYINKAIEISKAINTKFDVILIDGRARVGCAKICKELVHENSIIFIHDYNHPDPKYTRKEYYEAEQYLERIGGEHTMWKFKVK